MVISFPSVCPQNIGADSSPTACQYLDDEEVYSVEILKQREKLPCISGAGDNDAHICADQQLSLSAAETELSDLEADISRLLVTTWDLSDRLLKLEQEFSAVQLALNDPTAPGKEAVLIKHNITW